MKFSTLLVSLVLSVILSVNLASAIELEVKVTNTLLGQICSQTPDSNFCLRVLKSKPRLASVDLRGLALFSIRVMQAAASKGYAMINALNKKNNNAQLKLRYVSCSRNYASAIHELCVAKSNLKHGDYQGLYDHVSSAIEDVETCGDEFEVPPPIPPQLRRKNDNFGKLGFIVLAITQRLHA